MQAAPFETAAIPLRHTIAASDSTAVRDTLSVEGITCSKSPLTWCGRSANTSSSSALSASHRAVLVVRCSVARRAASPSPRPQRGRGALWAPRHPRATSECRATLDGPHLRCSSIGHGVPLGVAGSFELRRPLEKASRLRELPDHPDTPSRRRSAASWARAGLGPPGLGTRAPRMPQPAPKPPAKRRLTGRTDGWGPRR